MYLFIYLAFYLFIYLLIHLFIFSFFFKKKSNMPILLMWPAKGIGNYDQLQSLHRKNIACRFSKMSHVRDYIDYQLRGQGVNSLRTCTASIDHRQRGKATQKPSSFSWEMMKEPAQMVGFGLPDQGFSTLWIVFGMPFYHIMRISRAQINPKKWKIEKPRTLLQ